MVQYLRTTQFTALAVTAVVKRGQLSHALHHQPTIAQIAHASRPHGSSGPRRAGGSPPSWLQPQHGEPLGSSRSVRRTGNHPDTALKAEVAPQATVRGDCCGHCRGTARPQALCRSHPSDTSWSLRPQEVSKVILCITYGCYWGTSALMRDWDYK